MWECAIEGCGHRADADDLLVHHHALWGRGGPVGGCLGGGPAGVGIAVRPHRTLQFLFHLLATGALLRVVRIVDDVLRALVAAAES